MLAFVHVLTLILPWPWPMVTTFFKHIYQYMFVPNSYKTCRNTSMENWKDGHFWSCLGYHGNLQDAKCLPSLKINFRHPPTQSHQETLWTKQCTQIPQGTVLIYKQDEPIRGERRISKSKDMDNIHERSRQ